MSAVKCFTALEGSTNWFGKIYFFLNDSYYRYDIDLEVIDLGPQSAGFVSWAQLPHWGLKSDRI
jgi:hypothetical protein